MRSSIPEDSSVQPDLKLEVSDDTRNPRGWERVAFLSWRRRLLILTAVSIVAIASWFAWTQEPWPDVDHPPQDWQFLLYPWESNPELRLPLLAGDLTAIAESPKGTAVCAVGAGGLIYVSQDRGKTWQRPEFPLEAFKKSPFFRSSRVTPGADGPKRPPKAAADGMPGAVEPRRIVSASSRTIRAAALTPVVYQKEQGNSLAESVDEPAGAPGEPGSSVTENAGERGAESSLAPTLFDVKFVDEQRGWIVGDGAILATSDGGKKWQLVLPRSADAGDQGSTGKGGYSDDKKQAQVAPLPGVEQDDPTLMRTEFVGLAVQPDEKTPRAMAIGNVKTTSGGAPHGRLVRLEFEGPSTPLATFVPLRMAISATGNAPPRSVAGLKLDAIGRNEDGVGLISGRGIAEAGGTETLLFILETSGGDWQLHLPSVDAVPSPLEEPPPRGAIRLSRWSATGKDLWGLGSIADAGATSSSKPSFLIGLLGAERDQMRGLELRSTFSDVTESRIRSVAAIDSQHMIAVGDRRVILRGSRNGSLWSWKNVSSARPTPTAANRDDSTSPSPPPSGSSYLGVSIGRDRRVWIAGGSGAILSSDDDGVTWGRRTRTEPDGMFAKRYSRWIAPWYYGVCLAAAGMMLVALRPIRVADRAPEEARSNAVSDILVSDRPLRDGDADSLNFGPLVRSIVGFLTNRRTQPPLTLAIEGEWGSGKSSLMNMVTAGLEQMGHRCIWFNAWHHQSCDHLLAALLQAIRDQAAPPVWHSHFLPCRLKILRRRLGTWRVMLPLFVFLGLVSYMVSYGFPDFGWLIRISLRETNGGEDGVEDVSNFLAKLLGHLGIGGGAIGSLWLFMFRSFSAFVANPATLFATSDSTGKDRDSRISFRYQFAREFREFTDALQPYRLVLFIDDLDRCQTEQVLEMLEAVNFLVTSGDCIVVMGMDKTRILKCVGRRFLELEGGGESGGQPSGPTAWPAIVEVRKSDQESGASKADEAAKSDEPSIDHLDPKAARYAIKYLEKVINIWVQVPRPEESGWGRLVSDSLAVASAEEQERQRAARRAAEVKAVAVERGIKRCVLGLAVFACIAVAIVAGGGLAREVLRQRMVLKLEDSERQRKDKETRRLAEVAQLDRHAAHARAYWKGVASVFGLEGVLPIGPANIAAKASSATASANLDATGLPALNPRLRGEILAGEAVSKGWPWELFAMIAVCVFAAVYGLSTMVVLAKPTTDDSAGFQRALRKHLHLITAKNSTPRAVKQYLNRLRYLASSQEPPSDLPQPPFRRWLMSFWERGEEANDAPDRREEGIPAEQLVALSVVELYEKERLADVEAGRLNVSSWKPEPTDDDVQVLGKSISHPDIAEMAARYCRLTNKADLNPRA